MSRVAKMPVTIPSGVDVTMNEQHISVKGAGGQLSIANNALVKVVRQADTLTFVPSHTCANKAIQSADW
jgi:large subunit ribosomal protein L6